MRDIKFRVWIDNKMFYINDELYISFFNAKDAVDWAIYNRFDEGCFYKHDSSYSEMYKNNYLMQYTGLKDKKGKEIYEGDIFRLCGKQKRWMVKVIFIRGSFMLENYKGFLYDVNKACNIEIIGNIHEKPELLK